MGARKKSENKQDNSIVEINVIPLVDIVLVVLIIFMVAAPLVMQPKIDISLPKASNKVEDKDKKPLRVKLAKNGDIFFNDLKVTLESLPEETKKVIATSTDATALLIADKDATLDMITQLVDAVKM